MRKFAAVLLAVLMIMSVMPLAALPAFAADKQEYTLSLTEDTEIWSFNGDYSVFLLC